jgi:hypothetical protein
MCCGRFARATGSHFGVGGVVRAADCGFWRACLWGGQRTLSRTHGRERMNGAQMEVRFGVGGGCPCGGLWVSVSASVRRSTDSVTDSRT